MRSLTRPHRIAAVLGVLAALSACAGSPAGSPSSTRPAGSTTTGPAPAISHPTGADEVVISWVVDGGFVAPGALFGRMPRAVLAGDGTDYFIGAQIEIYPQPLLPPVLTARVTEAQTQTLLAAARAGRLFRDVTYGLPPTGIADAPTTTITIRADGHTWVHSAYALGMGGTETDPDRIALQRFVELLGPLADGPGTATTFVAARYAIRATSADQAGLPEGISPNEAAWPTGAGVSLAAATDCAVVERDRIGALFDTATQITRFVDGGAKYVLTVRPMVPGDIGC